MRRHRPPRPRPGPERAAFDYTGGWHWIDRLASALARWAGFLCLWLVIFRIDLAGVLVGAATAAGATWTSLRLLPPGTGRLRLSAFARLVVRFFGQSAVAGADVARRALDPGLPLRPGFVLCPTRLAPGRARDAFCTIASLLPGTLPAGSEPGALLMHCLDVGQDVPAQMADEEAMFRAALGGTSGNG
jgi:multicomponent Na+:H+ antiporter subunit E